MRRQVTSVFVSLLTLAFAARVNAQFVQLHDGPPAIETNGDGDAVLAPQRATVRIGVTVHAASAAEASAQDAKLLRSVVDTLVRSGLQRDSVQALSFGVGPNYDFGAGRKLIDYVASAVIRVPLQDLSRVGTVIDLALGAGATEIANVGYESDSMEIARHRALAQAFAKAQSDARAIAAAAGGHLGRLLEVSANDRFAGFGEMAFIAPAIDSPLSAAVAAAKPTGVPVRVSVRLRWEFLPGAVPALH